MKGVVGQQYFLVERERGEKMLQFRKESAKCGRQSDTVVVEEEQKWIWLAGRNA